MTGPGTSGGAAGTVARAVLVPLALSQFICSFAGSNMNVMINDISHDLHTTVQGVQLTITIFLLVMAALMIPGGKLTDKYGRKRCLNAGLILYGLGALVSAFSPSLWVLILGNSILEGVGTALLIPPVYILTTELFRDLTSRAKAFGAISAMGGVGAASGPLIGGLITTAISWRASFLFQVLVIVVIVVLSRREVTDPRPAEPDRVFDTAGAIRSAFGLILLVSGILAISKNIWVAIGLMVAAAGMLAWFLVAARNKQRAGGEPLLSPAMWANRTANLGMITQTTQWLLLMGMSFTVSAFLQVVRGYNAIQTGLVFTAFTVGLLGSSVIAGRLAKRFAQRDLIVTGFVIGLAGVILLLTLISVVKGVWPFLPGLFVSGVGIGLMLTPSVNIVQSAFSADKQGEISGLSRSVSNLGSSFGTAIAGTVLVIGIFQVPERAYGWALIVLVVAASTGLAAATFLPRTRPTPTPAEPARASAD
jgi:MFS family permease